MKVSLALFPDMAHEWRGAALRTFRSHFSSESRYVRPTRRYTCHGSGCSGAAAVALGQVRAAASPLQVYDLIPSAAIVNASWFSPHSSVASTATLLSQQLPLCSHCCARPIPELVAATVLYIYV